MRHSALALAALAALLALAGCTNLAPDYARPAVPLPAAWPAGSAPAPASATPAVADLAVDDFLRDERLRGTVRLALDNNRDLRVAAFNIDRARAQYGIQRAALFPAVSATGAVTRARTAADTTTTGRSTTTNTFSAGVGFSSWEIDFFNRVGNLTDAALETYFSTADTQRSTRLALVADTATAWLTLAADQRRLQLARDTLKSQQATYDLTSRAHAVGAESGLTLAQTRATAESARADVASYSRAVAQDRNALALLVGAQVPDALLPVAPAANGDPAAPLPEAAALVGVPDGLPSDVLVNRPDVLAAEHTLRGAFASIGAARAAFFPRITLTTQAGGASRDLDRLFAGDNRAWSFAPQIVLPIFTAGQLQASLDVARITRDINVAQYEKTLQTAFREVADALAARATLGEQLDAQRALLAADVTAFSLSQSRWRTGVDSYLDVQVNQRALYTAGQALITLQLAEQANRITLYKVLGGGWRTAQAGTTASP
ncbi:efflux transporter outer membrane subunit [Xylophilus sp.]|uniref:efflux transporter outer membrane subunit n=1 Tax=Xylophilus sp. TaxID=2653893 RepID=UPI0013B87BE3|nr:efflux transporter outer membrane subunit [Xylophilus sp.]KAF1049998.1 MAG: Outer membrane protein OprM [Xylophilus sp.]